MKPHFQCKRELQRKAYSCHVSPLPVNMKEYQLRRLFKDYSDVCGTFISPQKQKKNAKYTFGFVRFKSKKSADHAVQYLVNNVKGWPLAVRHAKEMDTNTQNSHSEPPSFVLDKDYVKVFKESSQADCNKESFDSTLKSINNKMVRNFYPQSPTSALSVDLTETTIQNTDYKLWHTFFREQNYISKSLMEIIRSQESLDISNSGKNDPKESKPIEEKDPGKDVCDSIRERCPLPNETHVEIKSIGRGNFRFLDRRSELYSKSREQSSFSEEFIYSESGEEKGEEEDKTYYISDDQKPEYFSDAEEEENIDHISEDEKLESFEDEELQTNGSHFTGDLTPKRNSFSPRCYPIGRGMGLALPFQKINNLSPEYSKITSQFKTCNLKDSISNTHLSEENVDESLRSWDVFSDP